MDKNKINLHLLAPDSLASDGQNTVNLESDAIILFTFEKIKKDESGNNAIVHMVTCGDDMISDESVIDVITDLIQRYIHKRHTKKLPNMENVVLESFELDQIGDGLKAASNAMISTVPLSDREAILRKKANMVSELLKKQLDVVKENFTK
jgi:hypothetical protein